MSIKSVARLDYNLNQQSKQNTFSIGRSSRQYLLSRDLRLNKKGKEGEIIFATLLKPRHPSSVFTYSKILKILVLESSALD